ncbi:MAG: sigma-70 family RNA polymerase sigma factor [Anaerolineaceae bacterium]|nr:sigma-70 family RNA polymerase sigma factor [Anaerolineaceae bacterium]
MRAERLPRRIVWGVAQSETILDWEAVYTEALPRLYNFFRYRVGNDLVAEDLAATTFEKAWRKRNSYRQDLAAFTTWLFAIARNVANDYYRRRRPEFYLDELESDPGNVHLANDPADNPEEIALRSAEFARLSVLLRQLSPRSQELIALKYGAGLANRDIANMIGMTESNVGTLASRIVARLRSEWEVDR